MIYIRNYIKIVYKNLKKEIKFHLLKFMFNGIFQKLLMNNL